MNLRKYWGHYLRRRIRRINRLGLKQGLDDVSFERDFNRRWVHNRCYVCAFNAPRIIHTLFISNLISCRKLVILDSYRRRKEKTRQVA